MLEVSPLGTGAVLCLERGGQTIEASNKNEYPPPPPPSRYIYTMVGPG